MYWQLQSTIFKWSLTVPSLLFTVLTLPSYAAASSSVNTLGATATSNTSIEVAQNLPAPTINPQPDPNRDRFPQPLPTPTPLPENTPPVLTPPTPQQNQTFPRKAFSFAI